jgi:methylmalonyl-CoA/ethylmalonyl-CoA epimerase
MCEPRVRSGYVAPRGRDRHFHTTPAPFGGFWIRAEKDRFHLYHFVKVKRKVATSEQEVLLVSENDVLASRMQAVDHLAVAVADLEAAVAFYRDRLGFVETERRSIAGQKTGMDSVVMKAGALKVVLIKGSSPASQVSRYVAEYGPGVQHVAFAVEGIEAVVEDLKNRGLPFDTDIIQAPGLKQAFSKRDPVSGMMFELIERTGEEGFSAQSVQKLFESLEQNDSY